MRNGTTDRLGMFNLPLPIQTIAGNIVAIRVYRVTATQSWNVEVIDEQGRVRGCTYKLNSYKDAMSEAQDYLDLVMDNLP